MRLHDLVDTYIGFKRSLGLDFCSDAKVLRRFCRAMGDINVTDVQPEAVLAFIAGTGPVTANWRQKFSVLGGLYRYAIGRNFATTSPLPTVVPKLPPPLVPYIYSTHELKRLLVATDAIQTPRSLLRALTYRTLLLLLYGTGMRVGEALSLTLHDTDLVSHILTIRDTKFYKTRLVPIGPQLTSELIHYEHRRLKLPLPVGDSSAFFCNRTGYRLHHTEVNRLFRRIREVAGVHRESAARYQPRIHDIRHTSAQHRLIAWYRAGADVQRLLPQLATYLGHVDIGSTQRYLTMTPELLHEASLRFEQYTQPEVHHE